MKLRRIDWPEFGCPPLAPAFCSADFERRLQRVRHRMEERGWTHLAVYGDREHCANLLWLTGFDPRFEEALLIIGPDPRPLIITGIECEQYLRISPLFEAGGLRHARCDAFSLPGIADGGQPLADILRPEGLRTTAIAGWKPGPQTTPAWIVDVLEPVATNAAGIFSDPADGLRTAVDANEIAWFEHANAKTSEALKRVLFAIRPDATDFELLAEARYDGSPIACDWGLKTGAQRITLSSPRGLRVAAGQPLTLNLSYRGANCCRAGIVAAAHDAYIDEFAAPFAEAMVDWLAHLAIGAPGGSLTARLPWRLAYTPGHLIHYEEWLETPFRADSTVPLRSGMLIQSDIGPGHPTHGPQRFEDTYALADGALRHTLRESHPDVWYRCQARRAFMEALGYTLPPEVLPLSNIAGLIAPLLLDPALVLAS